MSESVHRDQGVQTTSGLSIPENSLSRFCDLLQPFFQCLRVHPQCLLVTIHKMRNRPTIMHRICRGYKTQRGNQNLIIALHPDQLQGHLQRAGSINHRDSVPEPPCNPLGWPQSDPQTAPPMRQTCSQCTPEHNATRSFQSVVHAVE